MGASRAEWNRRMIMVRVAAFALLVCFVVTGVGHGGPAVEAAQGAAAKVTVDAIPETIEDFLAFQRRVAVTPEGGVASLIVAAKLYVRDPALGTKAFTAVLGKRNLDRRGGAWRGLQPRRSFLGKLVYLRRKPYMPDSYFSGTAPEKGYALGEGPWTIRVRANRYTKRKDGSRRLLVESSGTHWPRPFTVAKEDGLWKIAGNASSLFVGIRLPRKPGDDDIEEGVAAAPGRARAVKIRRPQQDLVEVQVAGFPESFGDFLATRNALARSPEGGVASFFLAAKLYMKDREEGMKAFTAVLGKNNLVPGNAYRGYEPDNAFRWKLKYLDRMPWAPETYARGTTPDNGYRPPAGPLRFHIKRNRFSKRPGERLRLLAVTSGAAFPRPFTVKKTSSGLWKIVGNASSFFTGMVKPKTE